MRTVLNLKSLLSCGSQLALGILLLTGLGGLTSSAQVTGADNFAEAAEISGLHGTVTTDTTPATTEVGELSHAGLPPRSTVWFEWTAPMNGAFQLDTVGSDFTTVIAVYTGTNVASMAQVAANYGSPSRVLLNAVMDQKYYIVVGGTGMLSAGTAVLNWAYYPSGSFRFASERTSMLDGAPVPAYVCAESEAFTRGRIDITTEEHRQFGVVVTVTRDFGYNGKVLVDFETTDVTAVGGMDYIPAQGTLEFNDFEMSKNFVVLILDDGGMPQSNRTFSVTLSNPRLDVLEAAEMVSSPRLDPAQSTALVQIMDLDIDPVIIRNFDTNGVFAGPTNSVFNFDTTVIRVGEDVTNRMGEVTVYVFRSRGNNEGVTLNYLVNGAPFFSDNQLNNTFALQPGSDYATPDPETAGWEGIGPDMSTPISGTLSWGQDDYEPKSFTFNVYLDDRTEFNEDFVIDLWRVVDGNPRRVGTVNTVTVTILFNDFNPPAGSVDQYHNPDFAVDMIPPVNTVPPSMAFPGTDGVVYDLALTPDEKSIIVGDFGSFNTVPRNRIARINVDGSLDSFFDPGNGADNFITSIRLQSDSRILIGGAFSFYNGVQRNGIARLSADGALDPTFTPGLGANGTVWAMAVQPDGKIIIGGEFTTVNGIVRPHVARLNADGSLDTTFDPSMNAPNGTVNAVAVTVSGQILIGGEFSAMGTETVNNLARLSSTGVLDTNFRNRLGLGINGPIYALALQGDGRLLVGGEFSAVNVTPRNRILRLQADGSLDTTFDPGIAADDTVYTITLASGGSMYVGGLFTSFNGTHRQGLVRLFSDGTVDTSFLDTAYNQFAGLPRPYFNTLASPKPFLFACKLQSDGNVMIAGGFDQVGGGQRDPRVQPPVASSFEVYEWLSRAGIRNRANVARLIGGATPGPGNLNLLYDNYSVNQKQSFLHVSLNRANGYLGFLSANFSVLPGLAQSGTDYLYSGIQPFYGGTWSLTRMLSHGYYGTNTMLANELGYEIRYDVDSRVTVTIPNPSISGDRYTRFQLANPSCADVFYLGAENIPLASALGRSSAGFTIVDDNQRPGTFGFVVSDYTITEGTNAFLTINRTNGTSGTVTVQFATTNGTAVAGIDYFSTNGNLTFLSGQTSKTVVVRTINNGLVQALDRTLDVRLFNLSGSAQFGIATTRVNIVDDDYPPGFIKFSPAVYTTNQNSGAVTLMLTRTGGSKTTVSVQCTTTNGTALAGSHYEATTRTFVWNDGDSSPRFFTVPLVKDGVAGPNLNFQARLSNGTVNGTNANTILAGSSPATINLIDDDYYGSLQFSASSYLINENAGGATITVIRTGGIAESLSVNYSTADGTAVGSGALPNYAPVAGTLVFAPGEVARSFTVPIINDGLPNLAPDSFYFTVALTNSNPVGVIGSVNVARVNIVDAQGYDYPAGSVEPTFTPTPGFDGDIYSVALQPDGRILVAGDFTTANGAPRNRLARVNSDSTLDLSFGSGLAGANSDVRVMALQTDGRIVTGGDFTMVNGVARNGLARLVADGNLDTSFNPGSGMDGTVFALAETFNGVNRNLLVGGSFSVVNGVPRSGLARLDNSGWLDPAFSPVLNVNGAVYAIAVYPTNTIEGGKILIGGEFTTVNGVTRNRIARLNADGSLDATFDPGTGADAPVRALAIQLDGRVLVGGAFETINDQSINRIARLNLDGSIDAAFKVGLGANDTVQAIAIQPDNRILLVGQFTRANAVSRNRITRLMPDGTVDPSINFGTGANSHVDAIALQPNGDIIIGGGFTEYDGSPRAGLARIYGGSISGSGSFEFVQSDFEVEETGTNAVVSIRRRGGTEGSMTVHFDTTDGTAASGVNYLPVSATLAFPPGETFQSINIPVLTDQLVTPDLTVNLLLNNVSPPAVMGNQPTATLSILNSDSLVTFGAETYFRAEDAVDGAATIQVQRQGSLRGLASVDFLTTTNGTAIAYTNYVPVTNTLIFQPGQSLASIKIPVLRDIRVMGDRTVIMVLTNAINTLLSTPATATLTIFDVDQAAGRFTFSPASYVVSENSGAVPVTVVRTNGSTGVVSVQYRTEPDSALPGVRYATTNGVLTFASGEVSKTLLVQILNTTVVEGDQTFNVVLSNPLGGASILSATNAPVTVLDDETGVGFSSPIYIGSETAGSVTLTLRRVGTNGVTSIGYITTNYTAQAGTNYQPASGTLNFARGEAVKTFNISLLHDPRVTGDLSFQVVLVNPSAPAQLMTPSTATVVVLDTDPGLAFTNANFYAIKSGTNVQISVLRSNANTGVVSVNYATTNGTAEAGIDYAAASGTLIFSNGVSLQSFTVPIINNRLVRGDREFSIGLFNPSAGAQILMPNIASVTITDDVAGLTFSSPVYSVSEKGVSASILVNRVGYTNSLVSVNYATSDGTARAGADYSSVSGTLTFTNGETDKVFSVPVINNNVVEGDKTVLLSLSGLVGNAVMINPAATLTIVEADGSLIVPAGTAVVTESGPVNGVIDPNETVSLLLGLRNASGTNTQNLIATLAPTNGLSNPSGPQNYGALIVRGPSVSRPFTFTATGTNGQVINAALKLQDGDARSEVVFSFTIGKGSRTFSNSVPIVINDATNATPYPSIINVSGLGGSVVKATVTITNFNHIWPADVSMLLVSPSNQKTYLMSKAGGPLSVNNLTLQFDDDALLSLPQSGKLTNGTFKPTAYPIAPPTFPLPAPPAPYATNLAVFKGSNPNGAWSLYVYDDTQLYAGYISNGWSLTLTTSELIPASSDLGIVMAADLETVVVHSNLTYLVAVTNFGPATAGEVIVSDLLPEDAEFVGYEASQGTVTTNAVGLATWNVGSLAIDQSAVLSFTIAPNEVGLITNSVSVSVISAGTDPNPDNNTAFAVASVMIPNADLALQMVGTPNPLDLGGNLTYVLTIANLGPAGAVGVSLANTLPSSVTFVSASPEGYVLAGNSLTFTNLGDLGAEGEVSATIVVSPLIGGEFTNSAVCTALTLDPLKANNTASVKNLVLSPVVPVPLTATRVGGSLVISWTDLSGAMILETTASLTPPVTWIPVATPPVVNGADRSVTVPIGAANAYYRLRGQNP